MSNLLPPPANNIAHQPPDILFSLPFPISVTWSHVRNCCQRIDSQQHPARGKQLVTCCCASHCAHFCDISVSYSLWLLHNTTQTFFYLRKGAAAPQKSRVSASLRSTSPLPLRKGHALDFFHPACLKAIIGLSGKALLLIFLLLTASLSEV